MLRLRIIKHKIQRKRDGSYGSFDIRNFKVKKFRSLNRKNESPFYNHMQKKK